MTGGLASSLRSGRSGGGLPLQFPDPFFHLFARLECNDKLLGDIDLRPCPWIPGLPCRSLFNLEDPKVSQLDAAFFYQCLDDSVERFLDNLLGLELGQPDLVRDSLNDLFLGHDLDS